MVTLVINNRIRVSGCTERLMQLLVEELRVPNPKYQNAIKMGYSTYGVDPFIFNYSMVDEHTVYLPRGILSWLVEQLETLAYTYNIVDERPDTEFIEVDSSCITLRDYQKEALIGLISRGQEGLLVSKAGSGKTVMGLSLLPILGRPMLWLTHTGTLFEQVLQRVNRFLPMLDKEDVGYIRASKQKVGRLFTVAMIQTLSRNPIKYAELKDQFGVVVVDECHHVPATTFTKVVSLFNPKYLYGLTATPVRKDGLEKLMYQTIGPILSDVPQHKIFESGGIIIPVVYYKNLYYPIRNTESYQNILQGLVDNDTRTAEICRDVVAEINAGNKCLVVTERRAHAGTLCRMLVEMSGKIVGLATGDFTTKQNEETVEKLRNDAISCLVATSSLLGEGFDEPSINRVFITLPIRNEVRTEQIVGRVQRTCIGKTDAIIYDYVDSHSLLQHQFYNKGTKGCRVNVYKRLGCDVRER